MEVAISIAPAALFTISEKKLMGCALGGCKTLREIPRFISLHRSGRLDLEGLITARRPLAQIARRSPPTCAAAWGSGR